MEPEERIHELMKGIVDLHLHAAPDYIPRKVTAYELALRAKKAGFKAIVIKSHHYPTVALAKALSEITGMQVLGGIALNEPVGGFNVHAVEVAIKMGARIVWMPTIDAWNHRHFYKQGGGLTILTPRGELRDDVEVILGLIADNNVALATGHLSPSEVEILVREAFRVGVRKVLVNHPIWGPTLMTESQQQRIANMGAYLEFTFYAMTPLGGSTPPSRIVKVIKQIGPERCVLSSDLGQVENPDPIDAWSDYLSLLLKCGLTEHQVRIMTSRNPEIIVK